MRNIKVTVCALLLCLVGTAVRAQDAENQCVSASEVAKSVIRISRYFDDTLGPSAPQGSAFFIGATKLIVVGHVAKALALGDEWQWVDIFQERIDGYYTIAMRMRVKETFTEGLPVGEGLYVLELERPYFAEITPLWLRLTPPANGEAMIGIGYTAGALSFAWGSFVQPGPRPPVTPHWTPDLFEGFELMNVFNREAIYPGASGGPIVDCFAAVVGVIARVSLLEPSPAIVQILHQAGVPLYRGYVNVWAVPTHPIAAEALQRGY